MSEFQVLPVGNLTYEIIRGVSVNAVVMTRYCACRDCHLIFQNPRLSDIELGKFYSTGYYRQTINATPEEVDGGELHRAKVDVEIIKRHIGEVKSHLDIGCGHGYLLNEVGSPRRVGVEPEVNYVKVEDIEIYPEMNKVPYKSFDLVSAIHVLEHVPYPLDYLKGIVKFIGKDGYLVIEVPTWKSPGGPLRFPHLYHFEPDVLKAICKQVGLNVIHEEFTPHLLLICNDNS